LCASAAQSTKRNNPQFHMPTFRSNFLIVKLKIRISTLLLAACELLSFIRNLAWEKEYRQLERERRANFPFSCPLFPFNNFPTAHTHIQREERVLCVNRYVILLVCSLRMILHWCRRRSNSRAPTRVGETSRFWDENFDFYHPNQQTRM